MQLPSSFQFIQSHLPSNTKGLGITTLSKGKGDVGLPMLRSLNF